MGIEKQTLTAMVLLPLVLAGCTSSNIEPTKHTEDRVKLNNPLYAKLEKTDSGWKFNQFSMTPNTSMVNLKTGQPEWKTKSRQCIAGLLVERRSNYCGKVENQNHFLFSSMNKGNAFLSVLVAPFTLGLSLTEVTKTVTFDKGAYTDAMNQAFADLPDKELLQNIDTTLSSWNSGRQGLLATYQHEISEFGPSFKKTLKDSSGLVDVASYNLDTMVRIVGARLPNKPKVSAVTLTEFNSALKKAKQTNLAKAKERFSTASVVCAYDKKLSTRYNLKVSCPSSVKIDTAKKKLDGEALFTILSVRKDELLPKHFTLKNKDIMLTMNSGIINIENKTDDYITVKNVAFYYQDEISSRENLSIELPPRAMTNANSALNIERNFNIKWSKLRNNSITKKLANTKTMSYGFAVKYKRSGINHDDEAYSKKKYKLKELL